MLLIIYCLIWHETIHVICLILFLLEMCTANDSFIATDSHTNWFFYCHSLFRVIMGFVTLWMINNFVIMPTILSPFCPFLGTLSLQFILIPFYKHQFQLFFKWWENFPILFIISIVNSCGVSGMSVTNKYPGPTCVRDDVLASNILFKNILMTWKSQTWL